MLRWSTINPQCLKQLLAISFCLNLFLFAGGAATICMLNRYKASFRRPLPAMDAWTQATINLTPASRERLKEVIKEAALSGEDELDEARRLRRRSVEIAAVDPYNATTLLVLSEQARSIEVMSRSKIETALIADMAVLSATERSVIASYFLRPTFRFRKFLVADARQGGDLRAVSKPFTGKQSTFLKESVDPIQPPGKSITE